MPMSFQITRRKLIVATLERLPAWSLAGGLIGLGLSLLIRAFAGSGRRQA